MNTNPADTGPVAVQQVTEGPPTRHVRAAIAALVAANFMAFLTHALSRLHERTTRLAAENTALLEQTEGLA